MVAMGNGGIGISAAADRGGRGALAAGRTRCDGGIIANGELVDGNANNIAVVHLGHHIADARRCGGSG